MVIKTVPNVVVDGQTMHPYSVDYSYGGNEPSEIIVKFINKNGIYDIPENDALAPIRIRIGNFQSLECFVVETEVSSAPRGGKILTIRYSDTSILLDKINIGIKGLHGPGFSTVSYGTFPSNLILVGKQLDPCESLQDSPVDPCAPICTEKGNKRDPFDCVKEKQLKVLQVDYSFEELKLAVESKIAFGAFPQSVNVNYRASYTGRLREVLSAWCADFGIGFYWESNSVYFYDISRGVPINDAALNSNTEIVSYSEKKSIKGNLAVIKSVYFGAEGEEREYSCSSTSSRAIDLKPITLYDLLADTTRSGTVSPVDQFIRSAYDPQNRNSQQALENFYDTICLSYYSDTLRDLYILFAKEGLVNPTAVEAWIETGKRAIPSLGGFKPLIVIHPDSEDQKLRDAYTTYRAKLDLSELPSFTAKGGYFIVAEYDENQHDSFSQMESSLANNFLGKYWIRPISRGGGYSYDAPDGTVNYYSSGSEIIFPFLNDLPTSIQKSSDFLQDIINTAQVDGEGNVSNTTAHGKFLLMERAAAWTPSKNSSTVVDLLKTVDPFHWSATSFELLDFSGLSLSYNSNTKTFSPKSVVFIAYPKPEKLDLEISTGVGQEDRNPVDAKNTSLQGELNGTNVSYGLNSALAKYFVIKSNGAAIQFFTPSQAGLRFGNEYGGYTILANGTSQSSDIKVVLPKKEVVLGSSKDLSQLDVGAEIQFKDATQNLVNFIDSSGEQSCGYNNAKIFNLLNSFNSRQNVITNIEKITKSYEIAGIPEARFTTSDGLESFSIVHGSDGVKTTVVFSNLPSRNRSETLEEKRFEEISAILGKAKKYFRNK